MAAMERKIPILIDCEKVRGNTTDFFKLIKTASYIVTNSKFPLLLTELCDPQTDLLEAMSQILKVSNQDSLQFVISTLGKEGSVLLQTNPSNLSESRVHIKSFSELEAKFNKSKGIETFIFDSLSNQSFLIYRCPSYPVENVIDTTGAGDAFIGGICFSLLHQYDIPTMLRLASFIASMKCTKEGSTLGLPSYSEIQHSIGLA